MRHTALPYKATNVLHTIRGAALMSLAIAGIAVVAFALYVVDRSAARQFWDTISTR